jgi:hypothetical protein
MHGANMQIVEDDDDDDGGGGGGGESDVFGRLLHKTHNLDNLKLKHVVRHTDTISKFCVY